MKIATFRRYVSTLLGNFRPSFRHATLTSANGCIYYIYLHVACMLCMYYMLLLKMGASWRGRKLLCVNIEISLARYTPQVNRAIDTAVNCMIPQRGEKITLN